MMFSITTIILQAACWGVIASVLEALLPDGATKRVAKSVISTVTLLAIAKPVIALIIH